MELINKARMEVLTRPGEAFNAPARVQRLADTIVVLCNELETHQMVLKGLASRHHGYHLGMGPCVCKDHLKAAELLKG